MVGVPRSTGCGLCVKRRVKCDQGRPACGNCIKYGADCPGYEREMKFVREKHNIRSRRGGSSESTVDRSPRSTHKSGSSSRRVSGDNRETHIGSEDSKEERIGAVMAILAQVEGIYGPTELEELIFIFRTVTMLLGNKIVLDNALLALGLHLLGKAQCDEHLLASSRSVYGESLRDLQSALKHKSEWKETETLCAAAVLLIFELFAATSGSGSWRTHATGIISLMERRGAHYYTRGIEGVVLVNIRKLLIFHELCPPDIVKESFWGSKDWQEACDFTCNSIASSMIPEHGIKLLAMNTFNSILADLPPILHDALKIHNHFHCQTQPSNSSVDRLSRRAESLYRRISTWQSIYANIAPNPQSGPASEGSIVSTIYTFQNSWVASFHLDCWAILMIVNESLRLCNIRPVESWEANMNLARNVVQSIETVSVGIMGPLRLAFSLRVAFEFVDLTTQQWIRSWLDQFSLRMGAMTSTSFPDISMNEYNTPMM